MPAEFASLVDPFLKGLEIITVGAGAGAVFYKLGQTTQKFEMIGAQQAKEITQLQASVEKVAIGQNRMEELITKVALQGQRLDNQAERINMLDKRIDELRRGEGLIR